MIAVCLSDLLLCDTVNTSMTNEWAVLFVHRVHVYVTCVYTYIPATISIIYAQVLVVGNPANTNCLTCAKSAPSLPATNFSCLTRLDHNRATSQVSPSTFNCRI